MQAHGAASPASLGAPLPKAAHCYVLGDAVAAAGLRAAAGTVWLVGRQRIARAVPPAQLRLQNCEN